MSNQGLVGVVKRIPKAADEHLPQILLAVGAAGVVVTPILAVKETPKALKLIEEKKREEEVDELEPIEIVKATWKCYIPAAVSALVSLTCLIGANSVNSRRHAALATAYALAESALHEFKESVVETVSKDGLKEIKQTIAKERIEKSPEKVNEIVVIDDGDALFYDHLSGRTFRSTVNDVERCINELNEEMINGQSYVSLNDFYDKVGLESTSIGAKIGWRIDSGLIDIDMIAEKTKDGRPCLVVYFDNDPKYDFDKWL